MSELLAGTLLLFSGLLLAGQGMPITRAIIWTLSRLAPPCVREDYRQDWTADLATIPGDVRRIALACLLAANLPGLWRTYHSPAETELISMQLRFVYSALVFVAALLGLLICLLIQPGPRTVTLTFRLIAMLASVHVAAGLIVLYRLHHRRPPEGAYRATTAYHAASWLLLSATLGVTSPQTSGTLSMNLFALLLTLLPAVSSVQFLRALSRSGQQARPGA